MVCLFTLLPEAPRPQPQHACTALRFTQINLPPPRSRSRSRSRRPNQPTNHPIQYIFFYVVHLIKLNELKPINTQELLVPVRQEGVLHGEGPQRGHARRPQVRAPVPRHGQVCVVCFTPYVVVCSVVCGCVDGDVWGSRYVFPSCRPTSAVWQTYMSR